MTLGIQGKLFAGLLLVAALGLTKGVNETRSVGTLQTPGRGQ